MFRVFVTVISLNGHVLGLMESREHYKFIAVCLASEPKIVQEVDTTLRRLYLNSGRLRAGHASCEVES